MANLGQLGQFIDDVDITFQYGRKKYSIKPPFTAVLRYMQEFEGWKDRKQPIDKYAIWELCAPLLGSTFDRETFEFGSVEDEDDPNRGLIPELLSKGMDIDTVDRIFAAVHVKYTHGDDVAEEFMKTGSLGKALQAVRLREEAAEKETQKTATETGEGD